MEEGLPIKDGKNLKAHSALNLAQNVHKIVFIVAYIMEVNNPVSVYSGIMILNLVWKALKKR